MTRTPRARDVLARPGLLLAMLALALNDHVLKQACPGVLTGKLSDLSGLFAAPLVAWAALDLVRRRPVGLRALGALCAATGLGFTLLKLCAGFRALYLEGYAWLGLPARVVPDPTDLLGLLAIGAAYAYGARHQRRGLPRGLGEAWRPALRAAVVGSFAVLTVATSPLPAPPETTIAEVTSQTGALAVRHDARRYVDRPFELVLPAGHYRAVTLLRRGHTLQHALGPVLSPGVDGCHNQEGQVRADVLVEWLAGDAHLEGDPVRLALPALPGRGETTEPREHRQLEARGLPPCGRWAVRVEQADGEVATLELRFVRSGS